MTAWHLVLKAPLCDVGHRARSYVFLQKTFNLQHLNSFYKGKDNRAILSSSLFLLKSSSSCINISSKLTPFSLAEDLWQAGILFYFFNLEILLKARQVRDLRLFGSFESLRHNLLQRKHDKAVRFLAVCSTAPSAAVASQQQRAELVLDTMLEMRQGASNPALAWFPQLSEHFLAPSLQHLPCGWPCASHQGLRWHYMDQIRS